MYRKLQESRIVLNIHVDVAEKYACNMRLYESTGVGTMLVTDWKSNLPELFEVGHEVLAYKSPTECADLVEYYLGRDDEREAIAETLQAWSDDGLCDVILTTGGTGFAERLQNLLLTWPAIVVLGLVIGGIYGGIFTPTEAAAVGNATIIEMLLKAGAKINAISPDEKA
jgi:TRAP-type mannitol/chloroaromatic compound transport system permease large subunit